MKRILVSCIIIASTMSCQKNADTQKTALIESAVPPAAAPPAAPVAAVAAGEVSAASVPVEEDFEQKAEATISATSTKQELDKLDKEIGQ